MKTLLAVVTASVVAGCVTPTAPADTLTAADVAALAKASRDCGLHDKTLTFVRNLVGGYDIKIDRAYGDPEPRIDCAFDRLPDDVEMKFGVGPIIAG